MPKKTNKTSHVLSLLTNGADPEEISGQDLSGERNTKKQEKAGTEAAPMESVQKVSSSGDKMVVVVDDQEENISNRIFDDLAKQLENQEAQDRVQEAQDRVQELQDGGREPQDGGQELQDGGREPQDGGQEPRDGDHDSGQEECHIENVMENIITRMDLKKYMEQYGVCRCSRCCADTKALILTRLPSKYVVVHEDSVAPMIGFYENKFKVRIFTEILKACLQVKEKPRHGL
ncbi:late competence development ComFB family protein [Enterocloster aldenensis]|uniref:late competence development ComFB family protein n=1 Tax=Enterocloster aldenensis TaxID=358742 RepID=UPI0025A33411|nr:late competence development ComFB family protein [Enterocloster aldenensis]